MGSEMHLFQYESQPTRKNCERLKSVWLATGSLIESLQGRETLQGFCVACGCVQCLNVHELDWDGTREGLACSVCGLSARLRVSLHVLERFAKRDSAIYITEQCTPLYAWMQPRYANLTGSEFEPDAARRAELAAVLKSMGGHGAIDYQDVTALSLPDASMDFVVSGDVLEHVPEPALAFGEFSRVLRKDGWLIATFPFNDSEDSLIRASLVDGQVVHHLPAEYHGDPISGGVLCFRHFGWDVLDMATEAGFKHCRMAMAWAPEAGIMYGHWLLLARKS